MNPEESIKIDEEKLCRNCGRCCHRKEIFKGKVFFTRDACPHLVKEENGETHCDVYDNRLGRTIDINGHVVRCITSEEAFRIHALPTDCPYVYYYSKGADKKLQSFLLFQWACETKDWEGIFPKPKKNCNKGCYGRGYIGKNVLTQAYVPCKCLS